MDSKILREYITQESNRHEVAARPPIAVTNAVSWRSEGIKHRKNEIFLDVVEKLNLLVRKRLRTGPPGRGAFELRLFGVRWLSSDSLGFVGFGVFITVQMLLRTVRNR